MMKGSSDRRLDAPEDAIVCACCSSTRVRDFSGTLLCKRCASETDRVCGECGSLDLVVCDEGPCICADCRSCESDKSVDWDDGDLVGDELMDTMAEMEREEQEDLDRL